MPAVLESVPSRNEAEEGKGKCTAALMVILGVLYSTPL